MIRQNETRDWITLIHLLFDDLVSGHLWNSSDNNGGWIGIISVLLFFYIHCQLMRSILNLSAYWILFYKVTLFKCKVCSIKGNIIQSVSYIGTVFVLIFVPLSCHILQTVDEIVLRSWQSTYEINVRTRKNKRNYCRFDPSPWWLLTTSLET